MGGRAIELEGVVGSEREVTAMGFGGDGENAAWANEDVVNVGVLAKLDGVDEVPGIIEFRLDEPGDEGFSLSTAPVSDSVLAHLSHRFVQEAGKDEQEEDSNGGSNDCDDMVAVLDAEAHQGKGGHGDYGEGE